MKHYRSFAEYALESSESKGLSSLPVPVVKFVGRESALSLPVITIIGVQVRVKFVDTTQYEVEYQVHLVCITRRG